MNKQHNSSIGKLDALHDDRQWGQVFSTLHTNGEPHLHNCNPMPIGHIDAPPHHDKIPAALSSPNAIINILEILQL